MNYNSNRNPGQAGGDQTPTEQPDNVKQDEIPSKDKDWKKNEPQSGIQDSAKNR